MADFTFFDEFINNLGGGNIDLDAHTFKAALTNTSFDSAADDEYADITEIANGNGYVTGGVTLGTVTWLETGPGDGVWQFDAADFGWTASGGSIGPFQYIYIYDDTSSGKKLVGSYDFGTAVTITLGNEFTVNIQADGIFQLGVGTIP